MGGWWEVPSFLFSLGSTTSYLVKPSPDLERLRPSSSPDLRALPTFSPIPRFGNGPRTRGNGLSRPCEAFPLGIHHFTRSKP